MITLPQNTARSTWKTALTWGIGLTIGLRIGLGIIMAAAWLILEPNLPSSLGPSVYGELEMPASRLGTLLLGVWPRWDAVHHLNLAMNGYFSVSLGDTVFYPLYAGLTRFIALLLGGNFILAGLIVSTLSAACAFSLLYVLGSAMFGLESGKWAAISMAVYPTAVFLVAPFTESLFIALTLASVYLAYRNRWLATAAFALLASLTRGPGILLTVPIAIIAARRFICSTDKSSIHAKLSALAAIAAPLVGGFAFIAWRSMAGFPSMTVILREYAGQSMVDPLTGLTTAIWQWFVTFDLPTTLDTLSALLLLAITVAIATNARWRKPEFLVFMIVSVVFHLSFRVHGATSLRSLSRYTLNLFPVFLVWGDYLASSRPKTRFILVVVSSALLLILSALYSLWFFVG